MRDRRVTPDLAVAVLWTALAAASQPAQAAVTTFTSRAAWEAAVAGEVTDAFDSAEEGLYRTPAAFPGGLLLTSLSSSPLDIQILDSGILGSREIHFRDFTSGAELALANNGNAFGFDYHASENWVLSANGKSVTLSPPASGFIGFVDDAAPISSFTLRGAAGAQGGISIDNLSRIGASFAGLLHSPLGDAELSVDAGGDLVVSNLGASGEDGVSIDVGKSNGWDGYFAPVTLPDPGSVQEFTFIGSGPDLPSQAATVIRAENIGGGEKELEIGFAGVSSMSMDAYLNGNLVYHKEGIRSVNKALPLLGVVILLYVLDHADAHVEISQKDGWSGGLSWNKAATVKIENGPQIETDLIRLTPTQLVGFETLEQVEIRGRGLQSFTLVDERVVMNHLPYGALGNATLAPAGDKLTVGNIGSTGNEGVSVDLGKAGPVDFSLEPIDPAGDAPVGAFLEIGTVGSIDGQERELGRFRTTKTAEGFETTADFSALDSPTLRAQIFREGELVADVPDHPASSPVFSSKWWKRWLRHCWPFPCDEPEFPLDTLFRIGGTSYVGDRLVLSPETASPMKIDHHTGATFRVSAIPEFTLAEASVTAAGCVPGPTTLCLNKGRFKVETAWKIADGTSGVGHAVHLTGDTGYFWFFDPANVEMILKVLDACSFNGRSWVFSSGLTDVEVTTTVTDTLSGAVKTYKNPQGTAFKPIQDTNAFSFCPVAAEQTSLVASDASEGAPLFLDGDRFRIDVEWQTADGTTGKGQAVQLTGDTGYFWFFDSANVELVIKILNACSFNNRFWVFSGGLTDVKVRILVTDTLKGTFKEYHNPLGSPLQPILDTSALATCP